MSPQFPRRAFLRNASLSALTIGFGQFPNLLHALDTSPAPAYAPKKTLVCIFQRGAMDGISAVQPLSDPNLARLRPQLLLSATQDTQAGGRLLPLDDRFGLHAELAPLHPFYQNGQMAIVHGVGSPLVNRSHFDMQDFLESGTPGVKSTPTGWLNRVSGRLGGSPTPFRAVSMTQARPRAFFGSAPGLAVDRLEALRISGNDAFRQRMAAAYEGSDGLARAGSEGLEALRLLESKQVTQMPTSGAYPTSSLGQSLRQIGQLIKADVGLEIAFAESNGWDSHSYQLGPYGGFTRNARDLATAMAAFWNDLGARRNNVILMTMTEFGRTIAENGSRGTDHGRGSCQFILGTDLRGGRIHGTVPELTTPNLADGRDLPVTMDFRSVFSAVTERHLGVRENIFPGYTGGSLTGLF